MSKKGQWFIVSAVIASATFVTISLLYGGYFSLDGSKIFIQDEGAFFNNVIYELNSTLGYSSSDAIFTENFKDFKSHMEQVALERGYFLSITNTSPLRISGTDIYMTLLSPTMNITKSFRIPLNTTSTTMPTTTTLPSTTTTISSTTTTISSTTTTVSSLIPLSACGIISNPGSYYLTGNVASAGTCFTIRSNNVIIDGRRNTITYGQSAIGYGIVNSGYNYTTVANLSIVQGSDVYSTSHGLYFNRSNNDSIYNNSFLELGYDSHGIYLDNNSTYNNVSSNNITTRGDNGYGIYLHYSSKNNITNNRMNTTNGYAFHVFGETIKSYYENYIDTTNTEQGEPTYYYFDLNNSVIQNTNNMGELHLGACNNVTIRNVTLDKDGILLAYARNCSIYRNPILIKGNYEYGIKIHSGSVSNNVSNNTISTNGSHSHGIYLSLSSNYNNFSDNVVNTIGSDSHGIYSNTNSDYNNVTRNKISTKGTDSFGVWLYSSENYIISGNNISTNGSSSQGVYLYRNCNYVILANNTIITNGSSSPGIYLFNNSFYNNMTNNIISTLGSSSYGIGLSYSSNNNLSSNTINTNGMYGNGIYVYNSSNSVLSRNNISTNGTEAHGFIVQEMSNYNNLTRNNMTTKGQFSSGLLIISSSNYNNLNNNSIYAYAYGGTGIWYNSSNYTLISSNNISTNGSFAPGIYFHSNSSYNKIDLNYISTNGTNSPGIYPHTNSNFNNLTNNSVYTNNSESFGIWLFSSSNSLVSRNNVSTREYRGVGLFLQASSLSTISGNIIKTLSSEGFGIYINGSCTGNRIYNNMFNTSEISATGGSGWESLLSYWNTSSQLGARVYGSGSYIGGNYYTNPTGSGFSDTCTRNANGFCTTAYDLFTRIGCSGAGCGISTDYLPLAR